MALALLSYLFVVLLARCSSASLTTTTQELCSTGYGATSPSTVPTSTSITSTTSLVTVKSRTVPISTITAAPSTTYVTETDTSFTIVYSTTSTFTETTTIETFITSTGTTSFTIFDTSITTVTEPTPTSTVPTSSGFTYPSPVPSETAAQKKRAARYEARPEHPRRDETAEKRGTLNSGMVQQAHLDLVQGTVKHSPAQYPTSVLCTDIIKVLSTSTVVRTAKPTTTTVPGSTITSTITTVSTSTESNYESFTAVTVSTTQTGTVLSYITSTVTTTSTETATLIPPTQTFYAACDAQNILVPPPGHYFASTNYNPPSFQTTVQTPHNTSYECCVACITTPYCKVAEFFSDPEFSDVRCDLDFGDSKTTCDAETVNVSIGDSVAGFNQSISGGNCGGKLAFSYQGF